MRFCFLLPALTLLCSFVEGLNIASFNIQIFGTTKYGKKDVVEVLVRVSVVCRVCVHVWLHLISLSQHFSCSTTNRFRKADKKVCFNFVTHSVLSPFENSVCSLGCVLRSCTVFSTAHDLLCVTPPIATRSICHY